MPHPRSFIAFGVLAGAVGGLLAFVFARIFAEPLIQKAVEYESGRETAQAALDKAAGLAPGEHEHEIFSRALQAAFWMMALAKAILAWYLPFSRRKRA